MTNSSIDEILCNAMQRDRYRLRRQWQRLGNLPAEDSQWSTWHEAIRVSQQERADRDASIPSFEYDEELPITQRRAEIIEQLQRRQTLILCGETGSGKSTQLPKICLEAGLGRSGVIGHTQPRRLAARAVGARIASELKTRVGDLVGFKIRFNDKTARGTLIKLMTDGVLLAETQSDRFLDQYEVLIIDEAHERSLNIDFLLAYVHNILPRRPDLKLIITSATIEPTRFAEHFADHLGPAPIIEVSGRTYPVEIRYRGDESTFSEPDASVSPTDGTPLQGLALAIDEVLQAGQGDVLVFLPTERDIRLASKYLRGWFTESGRHNSIDLLPLYARLSESEQNRIFEPHARRRIVLSTNVAESSLTVPNIHFVIDTGTARISRYASRQRIQRLPIEAISQASADQRAGRCGRLGPGICVRLYSESDFQSRTRFTTPEIRRSDLAAVILQCHMLHLGPLLELPLLDPPSPEAVRDGERTLREIGALTSSHQLTELGKQLGRLPCDPRVGRMLLEGHERGVLGDVLVIAAALESQDVRLRPPGQQASADEAHTEFRDPDSDFLALLRLWHFYERLRSELSRSKLGKALEQKYLSLQRYREWSDVVRQLKEMLATAGMHVGAPHTELLPLSAHANSNNSHPTAERQQVMVRGGGKSEAREKPRHSPSRHGNHSNATVPSKPNEKLANQPSKPKGYEAIHQSLLTGLLSGVATAGDHRIYQGTHGSSFSLWPGSGLFARQPKWIMAAEVVETTKRYGRIMAEIQPEWIETIAAPLLKHSFSDPHWSRKAQSALVYRRSTLYGLTIVERRQVQLAPIDPQMARDLFISHALVQGEAEIREKFYLDNQTELKRLHELAERTRRREWLVDPYKIELFYRERLPEEIVDLHSLRKWIRQHQGGEAEARLRIKPEDILDTEVIEPPAEHFPPQIQVGPTRLPLDYRFHPGDKSDGITVTVPQVALRQVSDEALGWLVPGLLEDKLLHMIRSLPKHLRRNFVPAPDVARKLANELSQQPKDNAFSSAVCTVLSKYAGEPIREQDFEWDRLPEHLRIRVKVIDDQGRELESGRDLKSLQSRFATDTPQLETIEAPSAVAQKWNNRRITAVDFEEIPKSLVIRRGGIKVAAFPAIVDEGDAVSLQLIDNADDATRLTQIGWLRLYAIKYRRELNSQVQHLPGFDKSAVLLGRLFPANALRDQLRDLAAKIAFVDNEPAITTVDDYVVRQFDAVRRISIASQEMASWLPKLAEHYQAMRLAIEAAPGPWREVAVSIRTQFEELMGGLFLTRLPWNDLKEYPRYLQGARCRWDKLRNGGVSKDRTLGEPVERALAQLRQLAGASSGAPVVDLSPAQLAIRIQIEELRISAYAQQLGTRQSVSAKRIEEALARLAVK